MRIKVRGVKQTVSKGVRYYYHRKTKTRISEPFGSAAFLARVEELNRQCKPAVEFAPGTLGALFTAYQASPEFTGLADLTKRDYRNVISRHATLAHLPVEVIDAPYLIKVRDKAFEKHGWRFANYTVDVFRLIFKWGKARDYCTSNPGLDVSRIRRPRDLPRRNRRWTDSELDRVLAAAAGGMRVAVALGAFAGMRLGDARRLLWSARNQGWLTWQQGKTGDEVSVPEHKRLREILDATPKTDVHVVARQRKRPIASKPDGDYTDDGFRASFRKVLIRAGVPKGLTFHGLRVTAATNLADAGCDADVIAAVTGHRSASMVKRYTEGADQRRRAKAGIRKLERKK